MTYQPNDPNTPNNDPFAPLSADTQSSTPPTYTPPAYAPQQKKGPNTLLMILLGAAITTVCICGACVAILGGSALSFLNNPTIQAGVSTAFSIMDLPDTLPDNATSQGTIEPNSTQHGTLQTQFETDAWTYQGNGGEQLTITLTSSKNSLNHIGIYDSKSKVLYKTKLFDSDSGKVSRTLTYTLPADGKYTILIGGVQGSYTLEVSSSR